jgi:hypothetical protein
MSIGDVAACRICVYIVFLAGGEADSAESAYLSARNTDTTCCHITDRHNYHLLTSFLTYNFS